MQQLLNKKNSQNIHFLLEQYFCEHYSDIDPQRAIKDITKIEEEGTQLMFILYHMELAFALPDVYRSLPSKNKKFFFDGEEKLLAWSFLKNAHVRETKALHHFLKVYGDNMPYCLWKLTSFKHLLRDSLQEISEEHVDVLQKLTHLGYDTPIKNLVNAITTEEVPLFV